MTPEKHAKIKSIFLEACGRPAESRREYVVTACRGDKILRREVERLIAHHLPAPANAEAEKPGLLNLALDIAEIPAFQTGEMINDRYRIVAMLGEGAMGRVYRADDTRLEVPVALKFLSKLHVMDVTWRKRVEREVNLSREVGHSNICRVYDLGEFKGAPYISMEYIDGENLSSLLRQVGRLTDQRAIDIARQLCAGLAAAHIHGVIHRDLKPANVMVSQKGRALITDFGLAVPTGQVERKEIRAGTPRYMAPEQLAGSAVSEKSDIYSLGLVLYEMFTGKPAFTAEDAAAYLQVHQTEDPIAPSDIVPDIDPSVEAVIMACLQKDPAKRPESALYVAASLPGGDLLAAALDAGQIPTREILADTAARGTISRSGMWKTAAAMLILFSLAFALGNNTHPIAAGKVKSPEVLLDRAREVTRLVGLGPSSNYEGRFFPAADAQVSQNVAALTGGDFSLAIPGREQVLFRYRESFAIPRSPGIDALSFIMPATNPLDIDSDPDASTTLYLDSQGRPLLFETRSRIQSASDTANWPSIVRIIGHDPENLTATEPLTRPGVYVDERLAFLASTQKLPEGIERIELGTAESRVSYFAVLREAAAAPVSLLFSTTARLKALLTLRGTVLIILLVVAIPAAWKNWRSRGDLVGAVRLGCFVAALRLASRLLSIRYFGGYAGVIDNLAGGAMNAVCEGMIIAMFYLALESHVRRLWPRTFGGWSRVLDGKLRDPFVGRDVLLGCLVGCFWAIMIFLDRHIPGWMGWQSRPQLRVSQSMDDLFSGRFAAAGALDTLLGGIYQGMAVLLILVIATRLVRGRTMPALFIAWLASAAMFVPVASHPVTAWTIYAFGIVGVALFVLIRWGLVSLLAGLMVTNLLCVLPITSHLDAWYAGYGIFACAVSLALGLWGLYQSLQEPGILKRKAIFRPIPAA